MAAASFLNGARGVTRPTTSRNLSVTVIGRLISIQSGCKLGDVTGSRRAPNHRSALASACRQRMAKASGGLSLALGGRRAFPQVGHPRAPMTELLAPH
jgi:hypothetical protein